MPSGRKAMVIIGTDGFVDYVQMPDGQKFMLGPVSVLRMITSLTPARACRRAVTTFLADKQVMLSVDLDHMWSLLPFHRARYSSTNPLMGRANHSPLLENTMIKSASYDTFSAHVELAEDIVAKVAATDEAINRLVAAGKRFNAAKAKQDLHKIASRVAEIAQNVDLAQPWVGNDLSDLSAKASEIQGLFLTAKEV
jgi:hypothetical protein